jgi:hypothetical protein
MKKIALAGVAAGMMMVSSQAMAAIVIDGTISPGEWTGAANYTIGNGGGIAYLRADTNYIYGGFDITGWTAAMGAASGGNLLGFGVWKANNSAGPLGTGVEFQQSTTPAAWGGDGPSGTMNGLASAFRINAVLQGSIPGDLMAMDSFATGHRVWEVKIPISSMLVSAGDDIWVVGGINYAGASHWYPDYYFPGYNGYAPVKVAAADSVPEPSTIALIAMALLSMLGFGAMRRRSEA